MKIFTFSLLLFSTFSGAFTQNTDDLKQTIRGIVVDEDTQSPLLGVNVVVASTDPLLGTSTGMDGGFKIENVPIGRQTIMLSYLGYEDKMLPNLLVSSGKELVLNLSMTESIVQMEMVTVSAGAGNKAAPVNEMALVSARSFSVEETKRFAAGIGDPARMMTAYAGVIGNGGDDQNAIIIRGNSPKGLLWRLDGIEIPNPNHYASEGASSGGISILSSNTLTKSDFYTGAFPAEFGNALSGAFDIKLRNGNNEKREYAFQASVLGIEAALEGPFNMDKGASYLVNYRYSTLGLFNDLGIQIVGKDDNTNYQDASFKVNIPTLNAGTFNILGIGGLSGNEFKPPGNTSRATFKSDMGAVGINHLFRLNKKSYLKSFVANSGTLLKREDLNINPNFTYEKHEKKVKTYLRIGTKLRTKINASHILEMGWSYALLAYNFQEKENLIYETSPPDVKESFHEKGQSGSLQAYGSWKYRINEQLSLINGFHVLHFNLNNQTVIEPRSAFKWQLTSRQSIGIAFGLHSRIESLEYYLAKVQAKEGYISQPNKNLGLTKAKHFVLSYDHVLAKDWYLKAETYYQQLYNIPVHHDHNNIFSTLLLESGYASDSLVNQGTGSNYGLELTAQRFFDQGFYLLFTTSFYEATYKALDGKKRNTPFNSNFGFNLLVGKEIIMGRLKQNLLGLNLRSTWGGNRRYIPIDLEASRLAHNEIKYFENAYENRLPDYWKIDFQIRYRINKSNVTHELGVEILNLTNHQNVATRYYSDHTQNIEDDLQTGIIPGIGYRLEF